MTNESHKHHRINPAAGQDEWYFPMKINSPADREYARVNGLEITSTLLGNRVIEAIMVPCVSSDSEHSAAAEEQHSLYKELIKDELAEQDREKQDGRCRIPDGKGGVMRCPTRIPNPLYKPGNGEPKTLPVSCDGCKYAAFKAEHTVVPFSALDTLDEDGEGVLPYEPVSPTTAFAADRYMELSKRFVAFVEKREPKLAPLAQQLALEYTVAEAARNINDAQSTAVGRSKKLQVLVKEFLDNEVTI